MPFSDKLRAMVNQGLDASRDLLEKAGAKAKELGELGVLKFEIFQLKTQAEKAVAQLGVEVYSAFTEKGQKSVSTESAGIKDTLAKIAKLEADIESREAEFKKKGGKEEELDKGSA
jgi:hypothetical protein